ncbi:MAG: hypothetical protein DI592_10030, partial [Stenotrophomonas maltophilia]
RAARTVLDLLFHRLVTWLAPILPFTMEDVWLSRFPSEDGSVHLEPFALADAAWLDAALAAKYASSSGSSDAADPGLAERVAQLEAAVAELQAQLAELRGN